MRQARTAALITAGALFAAVGVVLVVTTPWDVPPGRAVAPDPARDFTPAELARSAAFDAALSPPAYAGLLVGLAFVLILGLTPLGSRLIGRCTARVPGEASRPRLNRFARLVLAVIVMTTLVRIVGLPFGIWREDVLRRYGLSTQSWATWLTDQVKSLALNWALWIVALSLLYALARRFPRYWWAGAAAGGFALVVAVSFIYPVVVEPVFNRFHSLPAGPLRTQLLRMADRDGVPVEDVLVADASRRTTALNAYVSGFGSTRRIVLYDTLLKSPPARVESIVAHELGHAKRNDVLHGTLIGALGTSGAVCLLFLVLTSPRLRRRAGLDDDEAAGTDPRSVALLLAAVVVLTQISGPVQNLISRHIEARADAHALELTRDSATFISMQHELSVRNLSDLRPNRLEYLLWFSHPSGPERIAMARTWARLHDVPEPR